MRIDNKRISWLPHHAGGNEGLYSIMLTFNNDL